MRPRAVFLLLFVLTAAPIAGWASDPLADAQSAALSLQTDARASRIQAARPQWFLFDSLSVAAPLDLRDYLPPPSLAIPGPAPSETIDGIEIVGERGFIEQTAAALALLRKTSEYAQIKANIGVISQGRCSGMDVLAAKPTFYVGTKPKSPPSGGTLWYAGSIAHDSMHSKLYHDERQRLGGREPDPSVWTGSQAEKVCMFFQLQVLEELGAPKSVREYLEQSIGVTVKLSDAPTYQNIGAGSRDVCAERDW